MPHLNEMLHVDQAKLARIPEPILRHPAPPPSSTGYSPSNFGVCSVPGITAYPDPLRQFYRDGIPQYRVIPPKSLLS